MVGPVEKSRRTGKNFDLSLQSWIYIRWRRDRGEFLCRNGTKVDRLEVGRTLCGWLASCFRILYPRWTCGRLVVRSWNDPSRFVPPHRIGAWAFAMRDFST